MKLDVEVNEIVLSNVGTTGEFRIRNSAKAFKILSDGLYSNKIRAIIRELSCNAVDSHVAAGKADIPFEVHLPSALEPWFSVRDFGLGLSGDQVTSIYTTYFESTKTDSNDFIGALGLGSKSPFSYTENFTVTAIKSGVKRIYSAFINEMGVPSIVEMSEELTDEGNGVEVKFSVTERYDYNSFRYEATNVFQWFKNRPTVTGVQFEFNETSYKEQNIVPGVHILNSGGSMALMGNIAYPLGKISEPTKHFGDLAGLLDCSLVIEFDIGELDFAASREELSYVPMTINSIKRKLEELNTNLAKHFTTKVDAIDGEWARAEFLYEESRSRLYSAAVKKYVADTKFPLYDPTAYYGKKTFSLEIPALTARNLSISGFQCSRGSVRHKIGLTHEYTGATSIASMKISVDSSVIIVLNDLKTGCDARARYHYGKANMPGTVSVFCISHTDTDVAVRQVEYDKLIKELHNPPVVVKASELNKRPVVKREALSNQGIAYMRIKESSRYGYPDSYMWTPEQGTLSDTTKYYYVCLNGYNAETQTGVSFNATHLRTLMDNSGVADISNIVIHGVRKNRIKDIAGRSNWIWIEDKIKEEVAKVSTAHVQGLVAASILDHYSTRPYIDTAIARHLEPDSDYAKFAKECNGIKRATGNVAELVELCAKYGKTVQVDQIKEKLTNAKDVIINKYPLIKYISGASIKEIADYVTMIDNLPTIQQLT
jgi:hypothetical protein